MCRGIVMDGHVGDRSIGPSDSVDVVVVGLRDRIEGNTVIGDEESR